MGARAAAEQRLGPGALDLGAGHRTPYQFQPTAEAVIDPSGEREKLPTLWAGDIDAARIAVEPNGDATIVLTWDSNPPNDNQYRTVGVIHSTLPRPEEDTTVPPPADTGTPGTTVPPATSGHTVTPPPPGDHQAPALTVFSASRKLFAPGSQEGKVVAHYKDPTVSGRNDRKGLRIGTVLGWTQDEAGTAKLKITYAGCTAEKRTPDKTFGLHRCSRSDDKRPVVYTAELTAKRGGNRVTYLGKTNHGKKLQAGGVYKAELVAYDAAGNKSKAKALTLIVDVPVE